MTPIPYSPTDVAPVRQVFGGIVIGFDNLGRAIALAALVFAGTLAPGAAWGASIFLLAGLLGTATLLLRRFFVAPVFSNVQNAPVAILMPAVIAISQMGGTDLERVTTVFALLGTTACLAGVVLIAVARFNLGRFVRLMPFPVAAGYLAASGALLIVSAAYLVCPGGTCTLDMLARPNPELLSPALTIVLAVALGVASWKWRGFGLVGALVVALGAFYLSLAALGLHLDDARSLGLLPAEIGAPQVVQPFLPLAWADIRFDVLLDAAPLIVVAALIGVFSTLLNITGVELAVRRDIDTGRELTRSGVINIATGFGGGTLSFISASNTTSAALLGSHGRVPGMVTVAMLAIAAMFSADILALVPPFVAAGLLVFFGASILMRWLVETRREQSPQEWLLSLVIVVASLVVGMPAAVILGIILASLIFAVTYARLPMIRETTNLQTFRSTVDRGPAQTRYLDVYGKRVALVSLQGFLFFGSIEQLIKHIRALLEAEEPARTVILDFSRVSRMDASALAALRKLDILASSRRARVVLTEMNAEIAREVGRAGLLDETSALSIETTTEFALETVENDLLDQMHPAEANETVLSALERITGDRDAATRLVSAMQREEVGAGEVLVRQGARSGDIYMLENGGLSIFITTPNGERIRVRKQRQGSIVGEIAAYADVPRTADVVADVPSVVYRMTEARLAEIQKDQPDLAAFWHLAMATALAEKVDRTNKLLGQRMS